MADVWVFATDGKWTAALDAARGTDARVTVAVVGPPALAERAAAVSGADVVWVEPARDTPAEAYAGGLAELVAAAHPAALVSTAEPGARALLGAAATAIGAAVIPGVLRIDGGDAWTVQRAILGGEAIETLAVRRPLAAIVAGDEVGAGGPAPTAAGTVRKVDVPAAAMTVTGTEPAEAASGIGDARIVVSFGRGVRQQADVALIRQLADALGAEIACSMPVADDLGWLEKNRYVGRSGQHISPRLYLAVGISGAPQHLEGVRGAKVVAAVNNDPTARVFRSADYGVVGDLYQVVPELIAALRP